eukprot:895822-Alexandrium_andersonii.AAC.1
MTRPEIPHAPSRVTSTAVPASCTMSPKRRVTSRRHTESMSRAPCSTIWRSVATPTARPVEQS